MRQSHLVKGLLLSLIVMLMIQDGVALKCRELNTLKKFIYEQYCKRIPLQTKCVHFAFNECATDGCNGCINMNNCGNAGLEPCIKFADQVLGYAKAKDINISRADVTVLMGEAGMEFGMPSMPGYFSGGPSNPPNCKKISTANLSSPFNFRYGRKDCDTAPTTISTAELPNTLMSHEEVVEFFQHAFDFDERDIVSIMGAHTLGSATPATSGHDGIWTRRERDDDIDYNGSYEYDQLFGKKADYFFTKSLPFELTTFDNTYYKRMLDQRTNWQFSNLGGDTFGSARPQFDCIDNSSMANATANSSMTNATSNSSMTNATFCGMMLLTDFGIFLDISVNETSAPTCDVNEFQGSNPCPKFDTFSLVEKLAQNNSLFYERFANAWHKMVNYGYEGDDELMEACPCKA